METGREIFQKNFMHRIHDCCESVNVVMEKNVAQKVAKYPSLMPFRAVSALNYFNFTNRRLRKMGKTSNKSKDAWRSRNKDTILVKIDKGAREQWKAAAAFHGLSVNAMIIDAVEQLYIAGWRQCTANPDIENVEEK